jgi:hypothetical protein
MVGLYYATQYGAVERYFSTCGYHTMVYYGTQHMRDTDIHTHTQYDLNNDSNV